MTTNLKPVLVSVIGARHCDADAEEFAFQVGRRVAAVGAVLVCGGLGGVMAAAARGAKQGGGITIGLLPGTDKKDANPYIDIPLPTTIGFARNAMVAASGDVIIALPGSHGTLSEICYGLVFGRPILDMGGWGREGVVSVEGLPELESTLNRLIDEIRAARKESHAGTSGS
jgi:uncharacterized protein (TIGR00725 family)